MNNERYRIKERRFSFLHLGGGGLLIGIIGAWEVAGHAGLIDVALLPVPSAVVRAIGDMAAEHLLVEDTASTIFRITRGFALGAALGVSIGLATGLLRSLRLILEPVVQLLRPIPAVALVPLALVWFGIGEEAKLFIVGWAAFFPTWLNTHSGVQRVPLEFVWTARLLGASRARIVGQVILPWSMPFVFSGARISLGLSFAATVVAEMSGASEGLGYRILASHYAFRPDRMVAGIVLIGLLGAALDLLFRALVRRYGPWIGE